MRLLRGVLVLAMIGCTGSHELEAPVDGGPYADTTFFDVYTPPPPIACGGEACGAGEICCTRTLHCVVPGDPSCSVPAGSPSGACASNADCPSDQSCQAVDDRGNPLPNRCGGIGRCWTPSGTCGGIGPGVCGCDGHTYPDVCAANAARVRLVAGVPCGASANVGSRFCNGDADCTHGHCNTDPSDTVCIQDDPLIVCGTDAQCPSGQACCATNGFCFGPDHAIVCATPPAGTDFPCDTDADCQRYDGSWWNPGTSLYFCDGATCDGPGGCRIPTSCDGTLEPTCGCDGHTYQNACEVGASRVRVAHAGGC